jgi:hypothetical protein
VSLNYTFPIPLHYSTHKVFNSEVNSSSNTKFPWLHPTENCTVATMVFKITPLHGPHGKHSLPLLCMHVYCCVAWQRAFAWRGWHRKQFPFYCYGLFTEPLLSNMLIKSVTIPYTSYTYSMSEFAYEADKGPRHAHC